MEVQRDRDCRGNDISFAMPLNKQLFGYHQWCGAQRRLNKSWITGATKKITKISPMIEKEASIQAVNPIAITDIDAGYFIDLTHRPIRDKFLRFRYIDQIQKVLRTGILIGYERDECLRTEHQFIDEKKRLAAVERQLHYHNSAFEEYLSDDHEMSMEILNNAHQEVRRSNELIAKRDTLLNEFGQVRLEVYQCEEMWHVAKMCREFFRKVTSNSQQLTTHKSISCAENSKKSSQRTSILGTLECLIEAFEEDISDDCHGSEEISLRDPHEVSRIFAAIEQRNLDALIHLESLAGPIAEMTTTIVIAEELIGSEIRLIEESLGELKSLINTSEQRTRQLECYSVYLLNGVFQELVCSNSVLHLRVFTENTYESCVGPNDANLDCYSMMQVIEKTYESLNISLDSLPPEIVKICEKEGFAQEIKTMREAEDAARKFDLMHRLLAALERIMDPPYFDATSNSKPKSMTRHSKPQFSLSASKLPEKIRTESYPKSHVALERSRLSFNEKCHSTDRDISNELTILTQKGVTYKVSTDASPRDNDDEDCRDKISQYA